MRTNGAFKTNYRMRHRLLAWLLAVVMLAGMFPDIPIVYAAGDGGFQLSLSWYKNDNPIEYIYDSDSNETRLIRLKISYENKQVTSGYAPGELVITVPGLKGAVRSGGSDKAAAVAADNALTASGENKYDWSYTYSEATDTYTFVNNMTVSQNATFEGSFEIVWEIPSRETINGFEKEIQAKLRTANNEETTSGKVSYSQKTTKDLYTLSETASVMHSVEGLVAVLPEETTSADYTWVDYDIFGTDTYLSRDVRGKERFDCWFPEGAIVQGAGLVKTDALKVIDGKTYECWSVQKNITAESINPYLNNVRVAYPKDRYPMDTASVTNYVELYGTYYEENGEELLAEVQKTIKLSDYDFIDPPGDVYNLEKYLYGEKSAYIQAHCGQCWKYGAVNYLHLSDAGASYTAVFNMYLNQKLTDAESCDIVLVDDIMDVLMKDGTYRRLEDDEYHFTSVYIPANTEIQNANELFIQADQYVVELYGRHAGQAEFDGTPFYTGTITSKGQTIDIADSDMVGIKAVIKEIKEGIGYIIYDNWGNPSYIHFDVMRCSFVLHTDDAGIKTDGGQLINNMYIKLYGNNVQIYYEDGSPAWILPRAWLNSNFRRKHYGTDREFERDRTLYGEAIDREWDEIGIKDPKEEPPIIVGLDRESAALHILEIPNEFYVSNTIAEDQEAETKEAFYFQGEITGRFMLEEGSDVSKFALYTIIPEGLHLTDGYDTEQMLARALSYSYGGLGNYSSAYITDHVRLEVIEDYQGSGRQYIAFHFDFSDAPVQPENIKISGIPMAAYKNELEKEGVSITYTMRSGMLIDQPGKWYGNSVDNQAMENGIWKDLNQNGSTSDTASFSSDAVTIKKPESTNLELTKYVKTARTVRYVAPGENDEVPMTYGGGQYSYRLQAGLGDSDVTNFMFVDVLETADGCEWQGYFTGIDYSQAGGIFGGEEPTIYYASSDDLVPEALKTTASRNANWTADGSKAYEKYIKENWTTTKPDKVAAFAVFFENAVAPAGSEIYIDVIMQAPPGEEFAPYSKKAINDCLISYDKIKDDVVTEHQALPSNAVPVMFVPLMGDIILIKRDSTDRVALSGAEFILYKQEGDAPNPKADKEIGRYTTDVNGRLYANDLVYGTYYFKEISAPKGYELSDQLLKAVLAGEEPGAVVTVEFSDKRKDGEVTVKKVSDRLPELGLAGAKFTLYRADGTEVRSGLVTDANGQLTISGLEWGDYYIVETEAPKGYVLSGQKVPFSISADNDAGREVHLTVENEQKPAAAVLTKYEVLEDGKTQTAVYLEGAVYELYDSSDNKCGIYMTNADGKIYAENLAFGSYYFVETIAAQGYGKYTEKIHFTVDADHTEAELEVSTTDTRLTGKVWLQKLDDAGDYVEGAVYALFDAETEKQVGIDGKPASVTFTTNEEGIIEIEGLYWGDYYIQEIQSPKGYELNDKKYPVLINKETVANRILIYAVDDRMKGSVKLVKRDEETEKKALENAKFTLYRNDGSVYKEGLVTDANGELVVDALEWGSYYFLETEAPDGYGLNPDKIPFSVNYLTAGKTQELLVTDPQISCELTAVKRIKIADIVYAHGNPTFTFRVDGTDSNGKSHTYYKTVTFSEMYVKNYVEQYKKDNGGAEPLYIEASVIFTELPFGTYIITEVETNRYELKDIAATNGTVQEDGKSAKFVLDDEKKIYKAVLTNEKTDQGETSHTAQVTNIVNRERKLTAIVADWRGSEDVTTEILDKTLLDVYAVYDDGTQEPLDELKYELDIGTADNPFDSSMNGEYTITVSYEEGGRRRKDTFDVSLNVTAPFTWKILNEASFTDADGTKYDGTAAINGYLGSSSVVRFPSAVKGWKELIDSNGTYVDHTDKADKLYKVVQIDGYGDWHCAYGLDSDKIEGIILPDTLKTISAQAFRETRITSLTLPGDLKEIGREAFWGCTALKGNLVIPDSVTELGYQAFYGCSELDGTLTLGAGLTEIKEGVFQNCSRLTGSLIIPQKVTSIGNRAFMSCMGFNGTLTFENGSRLETIGDWAFATNWWNGDAPNFTGDLRLPDNLKTIGDYAFFDCDNFDGILTFPDGLTTIGCWAFWGCDHFTGGISIPDTVETIGNRAFAECQGFNGELKLPNNTKFTTIEPNTFYRCHYLIGTLNIPESVTEIGNGAFYECRSFTGQLILPESLKLIGGVRLDDGTIDSTSGDGGAFQGCRGFTGDLAIPLSVEFIGNQSFDYCSGFSGAALTIQEGNSLTSIGDRAFGDCGFDGNQSMIWIAMDVTADRIFTRADGTEFIREADTRYHEGDSTLSGAAPNIDNGVINTSKTTVGQSIFWGYQPCYGFFERD